MVEDKSINKLLVVIEGFLEQLELLDEAFCEVTPICETEGDFNDLDFVGEAREMVKEYKDWEPALLRENRALREIAKDLVYGLDMGICTIGFYDEGKKIYKDCKSKLEKLGVEIIET